jgi:hypothetical protein
VCDMHRTGAGRTGAGHPWLVSFRGTTVSNLTMPNVGPIYGLRRRKEGAMRRDLLLICSAILALGLISWTFWGNPEMGSVPRMHTDQSLEADPNLKLISERSAYMRTER